MQIGIDAGVTLTKLVALTGHGIEAHAVPTGATDLVRTWIDTHAPTSIGATGGGAATLATALGRPDVTLVSEFDAWARGMATIARTDALILPARHLLVSLGTGTSVLLLDGTQGQRLGGTALGGGTIVGLGQLLLGASDFASIAERATRGDRLRVDLLIGDVYVETRDGPIGCASASNFAKLESRDPDDVAHALIGLVGENVAMVAGAYARGHAVDTIVYCGTSLAHCDSLATIVRTYTELFGMTAVFPPHGAHCGAAGAAVLASAP